MRIVIEEWLAVIPNFELADPDTVTYGLGHIWGPRKIDVVYPVPAR
jgi:hypothetical protein